MNTKNLFSRKNGLTLFFEYANKYGLDGDG